jgi:hypothetical protein
MSACQSGVNVFRSVRDRGVLAVMTCCNWIIRGKRGSSRGWVLGFMFALALLLIHFCPRSSADTVSAEYRLKAAFLFHFAEFVDWPEDAFKDSTSLTYCTLGEDVFRGALDEGIDGKRLGNHLLRVQHLRQPQALQNCHILFVGGLDKKRQAAALASVKGEPVLTVGDSEQFVNEGGMIGFCLEENKVRFQINLKNAADAGLKISARLLILAKAVVGAPR